MGGWPRKDDSPQLQKLLQIRDELRQPDVGVQATVGKMDSQVAMGKLMAWTAGENFCTTKAYEYFRTRSNMKIWAKNVWSSFITLKHSFILWLSAQSKLLTKD